MKDCTGLADVVVGIRLSLIINRLQKINMKRTVLMVALGVSVIVLLAYGLSRESVMEVTNEKIVEVEKEVVVDALEVKIKEAQDSARDTIQAKAQAAYDAAYEYEMKTIEAQVLKEVETEIKARRTDVEKETGAF